MLIRGIERVCDKRWNTKNNNNNIPDWYEEVYIVLAESYDNVYATAHPEEDSAVREQ